MALKQPLLILGSGQLGLMTAEAAARLGLVVDRYDPENSRLLPGTSDFGCAIETQTVLQRYGAVTVEREAFPDSGQAAGLVQSDKNVARQALRVIPDRFDQKSMLDAQGIPNAPWMTLEQPPDLTTARDRFGDVVIKTRSGGYDGRGTWLLRAGDTLDDIPVDELCADAIVEQMVPFARELSIVGARNMAGDTVFYPLVRNWHVDGTLRLTLAPACQADAMQAEAEAMLARIMQTLDFRGVMAVEFFEADGQLLVNEIAPRVHNSGHWTQQGADLCQFALHAIALTDLPMHSPRVDGVTAMVNLIGVEFDDDWLARPGIVHWYGKSYRPNRKLGHVNLTGDSLADLQAQLEAWQDVMPAGAQDELAAEMHLLNS